MPCSTFVPILIGRYQMQDALLITIVYFLAATAFLMAAYTTQLWQFYLAMSLDYFYVCIGSGVRKDSFAVEARPT
jgi:hypothetical protein